jgi:hypothetical protein
VAGVQKGGRFCPVTLIFVKTNPVKNVKPDKY